MSSDYLSRYPASLNLSEEQKEAIFQNLAKSGFKVTTDKLMIKTAKDILTEEQMEILIQFIKNSQ